MQTAEQQRAYFDTFGYLVFPGLLRDEIGWIQDEFEAVFESQNSGHDGSQRTSIVPFIDQRERLAALLDHPAIRSIGSTLLGDDFNYIGGDGNYYTGDTGWHTDGRHNVGRYLKIALYLDPVAPDTGCLRVIPGTHRVAAQADWPSVFTAAHSDAEWGMPQNQVPHVALASQPGDVVVFDHNIMHASFGGGARRRMFTLNLSRHADTPDEIADLEEYIASLARFWNDRVHSDLMRATATPERMRHLEQVIAHEGRLATLAAMARTTQAEAARG